MDKNPGRWCLAGIIFIIIVGALLHFTYKWSGNNPVVGLFSPVNESTWEHLKMLFFPALIFSLIEYLYIGHKYNNYLPAKTVSFYLGISLIVIIFYLYTAILGKDNLVLDILTFIISVVISQCVSLKYMKMDSGNNNSPQIAAIIGIIILLTLFVYFTFYPLKAELFRDPLSGTYGINKLK